MSTLAISSATPEGRALLQALELQWNSQMSSASSQAGADVTLLALPDDPFFENQWYLFNVGQLANYEEFQDILGTPGLDINAVRAWSHGYTGAGVVVAVVDSGVQTDHPDLAPNINLGQQYDAITGDADANPDFLDPRNAHGTAVAGIIAAAGNDLGTIGVAYGAQIVPIRLIDPNAPVTTAEIANAISYGINFVDIYNHSWGPSDTVRGADGPDGLALAALINSAINGRGGLGAIHVFATGNGAGPGFSAGFQDIGIYDSASANGYINSRYTIGVGAVDHDGSPFNSDGTLTLYSEASTAMLVVAPSGSSQFDIVQNQSTGSTIFSTDETGDNGTNTGPLPNGIELDGDPLPETNYTSKFTTTSVAAAEVSGVIALMLEANPNLSYRDVQEILVRSARKVNPNDLSWIVNPIPFYRDPAPMVDTAATIHNPSPVIPLVTNGAGYSVSHGRLGEYAVEYGYGHGMVDAELAVLMAEQWHEKDQQLPPELTYLQFGHAGLGLTGPILAGQVSNDATMNQVVPGGIQLPGLNYPADYNGNFIPFWNEFGEMMPFMGMDPPVNRRGSFITIPGPDGENLMSVEWVEVQLDITGDANALDQLRIALKSPDGTVSELNNWHGRPGAHPYNDYQYYWDTTNPNSFRSVVDPPGALDTNADGNNTFSWVYSTNRNWGERSDGQWELHIENFSGQRLNLPGIRFAFHGRPISGERIAGFVNLNGGSEPFASNVTVVAKDHTTGEIAAQFIVGADGNYYFDLPAGLYDISVQDPKNRNIVALDGSNTPVWTGVSPGTTAISFNVFPTGTEDLVPTSGFVFADLDGNGLFDGDDVPAPGFTVYVDTNESGQFDAGDVSAVTNALGRYELIVTAASPTELTVGVRGPSDIWTPTNPVGGTQTAFYLPGFPVTADFALQPPAENQSSGSNQSGSILGVVFLDAEDPIGRGTAAVEPGIAGATVFADLDNDGVWDSGGANPEPSAVTQSNGAFFLANVGSGLVHVRIVAPTDHGITSPGSGVRDITLTSGGAATNVLFGVRNLAVNDWGDLLGYPTLPGENGPNHPKLNGFQLGARIDAEYTVIANAGATGDDNAGNGPIPDDEDGVVIVGNNAKIKPGANTLQVTVSGSGGYLNAWIDWNDDGDWLDANEHAVINEPLDGGLGGTSATHPVEVIAPAGMTVNALAARFRWGSSGIGFVGADIVGEVEDYRLPNFLAAPPVVGLLPGDYNNDLVVNQADFLVWKESFGSQSDLRADGNGDGLVNAADYTVWRNNKGATGSAAGSGSSLAEGAGSDSNSLTAASSLSLTNAVASQAEAESQPLNWTGLQFGTSSSLVAATLPVQHSSSEPVQSPLALLLIDEAWSTPAANADEVDSSLVNAIGGEDSGQATDLAVAALFDDPLSWDAGN